jgi:hypothetical protein
MEFAKNQETNSPTYSRIIYIMVREYLTPQQVKEFWFIFSTRLYCRLLHEQVPVAD